MLVVMLVIWMLLVSAEPLVVSMLVVMVSLIMLDVWMMATDILLILRNTLSGSYTVNCNNDVHNP